MILAVLGILIGALWALAARALGLPWWAVAAGVLPALGGILAGALCIAAARADTEMGAK